MFKPLPFFIGLRYLRAKRRPRLISIISLISIIGIMLGVAALITVLSVMNGFEKTMRESILSMVSHASIRTSDGEFPNWAGVLEQARAFPEVVGAAPFVERETMLRGRRFGGAVVRGIDPDLESEVADIADMLVTGSLGALSEKRWQVLLGAVLARRLGVVPGDEIVIFSPEVRAGPAGAMFTRRQFTVAGTLESGAQEYDAGLAVIALADAQTLFRLDDNISGIRLKVVDMMRAWDVARNLSEQLPGRYFVRDWSQENPIWFRSVQMEKTLMSLILSLIVLVAAINIISTLVMVVQDKQSDIAILKTMGLGPRRIMGVFMVQGSLIGVVGTILGVVLGIFISLNVDTLVVLLEQVLNRELISAEVYYISEFTADLRWYNVATFAVLSLVLALLATLYPAYRAARTDPVEALRYE